MIGARDIFRKRESGSKDYDIPQKAGMRERYLGEARNQQVE